MGNGINHTPFAAGWKGANYFVFTPLSLKTGHIANKCIFTLNISRERELHDNSNDDCVVTIDQFTQLHLACLFR